MQTISPYFSHPVNSFKWKLFLINFSPKLTAVFPIAS